MTEENEVKIPDVTELNREGIDFHYEARSNEGGIQRFACVNCLILDPAEAIALARHVDATVSVNNPPA